MSAIYGQFSLISEDAKIGENTRIGNFVFVRDNTVIGKGCVVGSYVDIEGDVRIGDFVSLQSGCYLTRGVVIEDHVFCGPRLVTMNDKYMCYGRPTMRVHHQAPRILRAARVGGASVLCPAVTIGENAVVGAGSVVHDFRDGPIAGSFDLPPRAGTKGCASGRIWKTEDRGLRQVRHWPGSLVAPRTQSILLLDIGHFLTGRARD